MVRDPLNLWPEASLEAGRPSRNLVGTGTTGTDRGTESGVQRVYLVAPVAVDDLPMSARIASDLRHLERMLAEVLRQG